MRGGGELLFLHTRRGEKGGGLAIAERDRPRLIEEENIDVARGLDGPAGSGEYMPLEKAIDAADADRAEEASDGGWDEADEQRHQHHDGDIHHSALPGQSF